MKNSHILGHNQPTVVQYGVAKMDIPAGGNGVRSLNFPIAKLTGPVGIMATVSMKESYGDAFVVYKTEAIPVTGGTQISIGASYRGSGTAPAFDVVCTYMILALPLEAKSSRTTRRAPRTR